MDSDKKDSAPQSNEMATSITMDDLFEFLSADSCDERLKILLAHAEKNKKIIKIRRLKNMEKYNDHFYEEISEQFGEFCRTKGIALKFKVAFANMAESARKQKKVDKSNLEEIKSRSAEANPEFTELLHTKGIKAKVKLIIENIKNDAAAAPHKTAVTIDNISAQTRANIELAQSIVHGAAAGYGSQVNGVSRENREKYNPDDLSREFNEFLKAKGLDEIYVAEVTEDVSDRE